MLMLCLYVHSSNHKLISEHFNTEKTAYFTELFEQVSVVVQQIVRTAISIILSYHILLLPITVARNLLTIHIMN